jgi:hypothetical protein
MIHDTFLIVKLLTSFKFEYLVIYSTIDYNLS